MAKTKAEQKKCIECGKKKDIKEFKDKKLKSGYGKKCQKCKGVKKRKPRRKKDGLVKMTSPVRPEMEFYVASDQADEQAIEAEIMGQVLPHFIYKFKDGKGNEVKGLSLQGVRETTRRINRMKNSGQRIRISPEPPIISRDVEYNGKKGIEILVYAEDIESGGGSWGNAFEPYVKVGKGGKTYPSQFPERVALSKAQRNALRALIPETTAVAMIDQLSKDQNKVKEIEAPAQQTDVIEPQKTSEQQLYASSLKRIQQIKDDKESLEKAKAKVDELPINKENKERLKNEIQSHLK